MCCGHRADTHWSVLVKTLTTVQSKHLYAITMSDERGFLTGTDREFLTGEHEYTGESAKQQRYQRREAIAERTRQAFYDFAFLYDVLDPHERDRVFNPDESDTVELVEAMRDTIAFLYRALEGDRDRPISRDRSVTVNFNQVFEPGIKRGERDRQPQDDRALQNLFAGHGYVEYEPFRVEYRQNPPIPDPDVIVERLVDDGVHAVSDDELSALIHRATLETCAPEPASQSEHTERFDLHALADRVAEYDASRGADPDSEE